jgi:predicted nucleic acid-binding Zn ribbon protein
MCEWIREAYHSITEDPVIRCDKCEAQMVRRPQKFGLTLKGGGWASSREGIGDADAGVPPDRPRELGGTLNTDASR